MILYLFALFELCLFDCSELLDTKLSNIARLLTQKLSFFSLSPLACALRLQGFSANLLSPSSAGLLCVRRAAVVRGVCSRPAVSVPFSVAFITDLTNIKDCNSMCDCCFARFASASTCRERVGSWKIHPLRIIVVSRGYNCTLHFQRLTKASGMRRKLDERGIPNKWVVNKKTGSGSRLVFLVQV